MNALRSIVERIGRVALAHLTLACAFPMTMAAQNLVKNAGFEIPATGVPAGTTVAYTSFCNSGTSAASVWLEPNQIKVDTPRHDLRSAEEALEYGYECARLWIEAMDHRGYT